MRTAEWVVMVILGMILATSIANAAAETVSNGMFSAASVIEEAAHAAP